MLGIFHFSAFQMLELFIDKTKHFHSYQIPTHMSYEI